MGLALALAGAALGLEVWLCLVLAALGPVTEAMRSRRLGSRLLWTAIVAGLCAQLTAIFATPFTWPLRFGFFSVLLGAGVGYYALQTDD